MTQTVADTHFCWVIHENKCKRCSIYVAKVCTIYDVKMCKTKYLVYFTAIRSSVSTLLEVTPIIDPFSMPFRDNNSCFKKYNYVTETNFDLQFDIVLVQDRFDPI